MNTGFVDMDLAPVVALTIGNKDRVAFVGRVIHQALSIWRPGRMQPAFEERTMSPGTTGVSHVRRRFGRSGTCSRNQICELSSENPT